MVPGDLWPCEKKFLQELEWREATVTVLLATVYSREQSRLCCVWQVWAFEVFKGERYFILKLRVLKCDERHTACFCRGKCVINKAASHPSCQGWTVLTDQLLFCIFPFEQANISNTYFRIIPVFQGGRFALHNVSWEEASVIPNNVLSPVIAM